MTREAKGSVTSFTNCKNERLSESARCYSRPLIKLTSRTRSVSPAPQNLLVSGKLPFKKFNNIYAKVVVQLELLKNLLETKKNEVENLADLRRQLQRGDEFSIRFSRNNIYETRRIMGDIKKIMVQYPSGTLPSAECKALGKKIILAYQAASQALQTYINYVKNPSNLEVPDKINELVVLIADMFLFCDRLALVPSEARVKNDSVKVCNDLMEVLSKKVTPLQELRLKETEIKKKAKSQSQTGEVSKNNLSMYMTKLTRIKTETSKKQKTSFLPVKPKKAEKKNEDAARVTHEIYTQKMSPQLLLKRKIVKFEPGADDEKKQGVRTCGRHSKFTPREVKSQDDDVETIIQTIADEETTIGRRRLTPRESDEESSGSNKSTIRQLLLEAIDELQQPENKPRKTTLEKLLNSIQNHPRNPNVKVYNFKSKDFDVEEAPKEEDEKKEKPEVDLMELHEKQKALDEMLSKERRLKFKFKLVKEKKTEEEEEEEGKVVPKGKIRLKISKDTVDNLHKQRKAFYEFRNSNIMYKKTLANKPWDLIAKVADHVLLDTIREVALDFQNDALLRRLYLNELLEVTN